MSPVELLAAASPICRPNLFGVHKPRRHPTRVEVWTAGTSICRQAAFVSHLTSRALYPSGGVDSWPVTSSTGSLNG